MTDNNKKELNNNMRGALWARADGIQAEGDRTPPVASGVCEIDGEKFSVSLWFSTSDDDDLNYDLKKALVDLTEEMGGDLRSDGATGGKPVIRLSFQRRDDDGGSSRKAPKRSKFQF